MKLGHGPGVAVADRFTGGRDEASVVAAGRDDVVDMRGLVAGDPCRNIGVEVSGGDAGLLDGPVDNVGLLVGRCDHGEAATGVVDVDPCRCDPVEVVIERAGDDPAVGFVGVERSGVADAQFIFGNPADRLVAGKWAQAGNLSKDTVGVFRPSTRTIYLKFSNSQGVADVSFPYGSASMWPVAGNFGSLPGGSAPPG